jgi:hypothetical protein
MTPTLVWDSITVVMPCYKCSRSSRRSLFAKSPPCANNSSWSHFGVQVRRGHAFVDRDQPVASAPQTRAAGLPRCAAPRVEWTVSPPPRAASLGAILARARAPGAQRGMFAGTHLNRPLTGRSDELRDPCGRRRLTRRLCAGIRTHSTVRRRYTARLHIRLGH